MAWLWITAWGCSVGGVFINYRGADSQTAAALIDQQLTTCFGRDDVFLDSRSIPAGSDFVDELLGRLRLSSVLLVVIGPHWLTLTDETGRRRIDNPADWIRRELVEAFTHGLRIIPVLTDDATLPAEKDLPDSIAGLSRRQYVPLRRRYYQTDLAYLVERIIEAQPELSRVARRHQARAAPTPKFPPENRSMTGAHPNQIEVGSPLGVRGEATSTPLMVGNLPPRADSFQDRATYEVLKRVTGPGQTTVLAQVVAGLGGA